MPPMSPIDPSWSAPLSPELPYGPERRQVAGIDVKTAPLGGPQVPPSPSPSYTLTAHGFPPSFGPLTPPPPIGQRRSLSPLRPPKFCTAPRYRFAPLLSVDADPVGTLHILESHAFLLSFFMSVHLVCLLRWRTELHLCIPRPSLPRFGCAVWSMAFPVLSSVFVALLPASSLSQALYALFSCGFPSFFSPFFYFFCLPFFFFFILPPPLLPVRPPPPHHPPPAA